MASSIEILALAKMSFWDNKPTALLSNTSNSFSVPNNSFAAITWNQAIDDNWGGHSNSVNPSRYTAQVAGLYRFCGTMAIAANATGYRLTGWFLNGSEFSIGSRYYFPSPSGTVISSVAAASIKIRMSVGDYVEMFVFQNSGGALATTDGTWMDVEFVHF